MKIINPSIYVYPFNGTAIMAKIEECGRTCYKSEAKITEESADHFIANLLRRKHESVLEHSSITIRIICDRGVTHELVRHRLCSFSQESTRYCDYKNEIEFIKPCFWDEGSTQYNTWVNAMKFSEACYKNLRNEGGTPQEARSVLPNSLKTEIVITANLREWRHILDLRCSRASHPQMREIALMILTELYDKLPIIFMDLYEDYIEV
jgi:thymidylate synthase (FAD)